MFTTFAEVAGATTEADDQSPNLAPVASEGCENSNDEIEEEAKN